jgi:hypothetical protein
MNRESRAPEKNHDPTNVYSDSFALSSFVRVVRGQISLLFARSVVHNIFLV